MTPMDKDKQIIAKQDELIRKLKNELKRKWFSPQSKLGITESELEALESELASLKSQPEPDKNKLLWSTNAMDYANHFMQIRDLTDEEWLKLPKEEILQLYKNCYSQLKALIPCDQYGYPLAKTDNKVTQPEVEGAEEYVNIKFPDTHVWTDAQIHFSKKELIQLLNDFARQREGGKKDEICTCNNEDQFWDNGKGCFVCGKCSKNI